MKLPAQAEQIVKDFYENTGWTSNEDGTSVDAQLWEDLRPCARDYVKACRLKLVEHLPRSGEFFLDCASGPIQYPEYLAFSEGFKTRVCVDLSRRALNQARSRLGNKGAYICASMLNLPFPTSYFDAIVSLHTVYHIDRDQQEHAVRELLRVAKPGVPVIVVYSNPDRLLARVRKLLGRNRASGSKPEGRLSKSESQPLYFHAHPLAWWDRFKAQATVDVYSWRTLTAQDAKNVIPDSRVGAFLLASLLKFEGLFPRLASRWGAYQTIALRKR